MHDGAGIAPVAVSRLSLALQDGLFDLSGVAAGQAGCVVRGAVAGQDLSALLGVDPLVVSPLKTDHEQLSAKAIRVALEPPGRAGLSVIFLPRAKALARHLVAEAVAMTDGPVILDGQKTDGIDSLIRDLRRLGIAGPVLAKAHGKLVVLPPSDGRALEGWHVSGAAQDAGEGFVTRPGVFSADGIDPASRMLADHLAEGQSGGRALRLRGRVADLGAGWGYLSARLLARDAITTLDLVEVDHGALDCARLNVTDPRARFHWADATTWRPDAPLDAVVMNPPFHTGRAASPDLGRAFLRGAAACLGPQGQLFMVANRHLPYEPTLSDLFRTVTEIAGDTRFKVIAAERPLRPAARARSA